MTVTLFALTDPMSGRIRGQALLCIQTRYAAIRWAQTPVLRRCRGTLEIWRAVAEEAAGTCRPWALPTTSAFVRLLAVDGVDVQYVTVEPLAAKTHRDVAAALDRRLSGWATP